MAKPEKPKRPERSRFKSGWDATLKLLDAELRHLNARSIVIQAYVDESQVRNDGMMYSRAVPTEPGVILSFESKHGSLSYPCDTYDRWQDNVRAIALALQALRSVDRYGVTRRAEQYTGWQQLPPPVDSRSAASEMCCLAGVPVGTPITRDVIHKALVRNHPRPWRRQSEIQSDERT